MMFEYSDAWFLTPLIRANVWLSLVEITDACDCISYAIISQSEIDNALDKLVPLGYVEICENKYRATDKAQELANCSAYKRAGLFSITEVILKRLNKSHHNKISMGHGAFKVSATL